MLQSQIDSPDILLQCMCRFKATGLESTSSSSSAAPEHSWEGLTQARPSRHAFTGKRPACGQIDVEKINICSSRLSLCLRFAADSGVVPHDKVQTISAKSRRRKMTQNCPQSWVNIWPKVGSISGPSTLRNKLDQNEGQLLGQLKTTQILHFLKCHSPCRKKNIYQETKTQNLDIKTQNLDQMFTQKHVISARYWLYNTYAVSGWVKSRSTNWPEHCSLEVHVRCSSQSTSFWCCQNRGFREKCVSSIWEFSVFVFWTNFMSWVPVRVLFADVWQLIPGPPFFGFLWGVFFVLGCFVVVVGVVVT